MDGDGGDPLGGRHQLLGQHLLDEIVDADRPLGGDEEERFGRVESDGLD